MSAAIQSIHQEPRAAAATSSVPRDMLTQDDFLTLLVTQLKNQDPLSPLDNEKFVAQLAQFSTVSGITNTNSKLDALTQLAAANVRTGALQWIGRTVETADGLIGSVKSVAVGHDNSLTITLESGESFPASAVKTMS